MGSAAAPTSSPAPAAAPPDTGAGWHHNFETVDLDALEALYAFLEDATIVSPNGWDHYGPAWRAGIDAALATVYRQLLVRGGRGLFAGDLALVDVAELNIREARCESPVCHLAHDVDGRHRKVAHL